MEENHHFPIARGGGSVGFEALVQPHLTTAFRVAFLIVHDYHLAQDAVQEALWEAYQSLYRYDERKGTSFRAWFMKIVTHRALNLVRRKKKTEEYADSIDPDQNPLESILQKEKEQQIWRAIQTMTPKHRSAVVLYYYEEFSIAEIAKILGVFEGTVKSRLHKARKLIAEKIQAEKETQVINEMGVIMHD
ncbi:RNA polymerase sigma factor [Brevibacillus laterosporus]|uniref:RNA polymerase sigma factor n=1 Tax=Brevibacillus laterosporus TaxID=1465 RepID=A0AAP8U5U1_BRELA|nr:RNA polymerase sigma factor [Brevibacillus laterosporus]ATO49336.1 RNA polymerase [Brevibacillus laterosporus DSM 25]MBG9776071.1 RNA polymerase [Brevibacillus laterosporus]MBG9800784.1 RNA polymerase [Brevibacillus laterosporus]MED2004590.1 RNA polymerase sigma factor [Brevibacillus laterosporus]MED4762227.1 RNA polymerase sigma factor [Brevibacillus laterosporus]